MKDFTLIIPHPQLCPDHMRTEGRRTEDERVLRAYKKWRAQNTENITRTCIGSTTVSHRNEFCPKLFQFCLRTL